MSALSEISATQELVAELSFKNNHITCSSLDIACHFEKRHDNVTRAIANLEIPEYFRALNFEETQQQIEMPTGGFRAEKYYEITRDGFALLCMGFTGKKAAAWKVAYINAFNQMEAKLKQPQLTPAHIRSKNIENISRLTEAVNQLPPMAWEATRSLELMIINEARDSLRSDGNMLLLEDQRSTFKAMGLDASENREHPSVKLFWQQVMEIGLPLLNRSREAMLLAISISRYSKWVKKLGLQPVMKEAELDRVFQTSKEYHYIGKKHHSRADICWFFASPYPCKWIDEQYEKSIDWFLNHHETTLAKKTTSNF